MSASGAVAAMHGRIIRAFAESGAFSEAEAKSLDELGLRHFARGIFRRMEQRGIIIRTANDRYYMDRTYYDARAKRIRIVLPIAFILLAAVIVCAIMFAK